MLKLTPHGDRDRRNLEDAFDAVRKIVNSIKTREWEADNLTRVMEISTLLQDFNVTFCSLRSISPNS
jgi:hypothetical protein